MTQNLDVAFKDQLWLPSMKLRSAGGPDVQTNTLNPFASGTPDQLMNLVVSLMSGAASANGIWKSRATSLVTAAMKALCHMRDSGEVLLDVQKVREFFPLGSGLRKEFIGRRRITDIGEISPEARADLRRRTGMIELYLRSLDGEFSRGARLALKGYFDTLPGFDQDHRRAPQDDDGESSRKRNRR